MNILVFGKTGQVGMELQKNANVLAVGRETADLMNPQSCADIILETRPDAVINAAAFTSVDRAEDDPAAFVINGDSPSAMAKAATKLDIPLVHISTDYVFNGTGTSAWSPEDAVAPVNAYGRSKLAGEIGVRSAGGVHAILRTSWVFSANGTNFVKTMLRLAETRNTINVVSDQIGGPTPAVAIADACLKVARDLIVNPSKSGTYHFSGSPDVSWADFARSIFEIAGKSIAIEKIPASDYPTPARRPANSRLDCSSLSEQFAISQPDWRTGLTKVLLELKAI